MLAVLVMELILRFSATETEADPFRIAGVPLSPSRASETDDQHAKRVSQNTIRVIRPAAEMQNEDKVNADLPLGLLQVLLARLADDGIPPTPVDPAKEGAGMAAREGA